MLFLFLIIQVALNIVWDLLMRLPVNEKTKKSLYDINDSWENLLGVKSMQKYKLLYCLQIIEEFLFDKQATTHLYLFDFFNHNKFIVPIRLTRNLKLYSRILNGLLDVYYNFLNHFRAQKFFISGGLYTLKSILLHSDITKTNSTISHKCLSIILRFYNVFFTE